MIGNLLVIDETKRNEHNQEGYILNVRFMLLRKTKVVSLRNDADSDKKKERQFP